MEEVNFLWVLHSISQGNYYLPVLDTTVFKEEKLFCEYTIQSNIFTRKTSFDPIPVSTYVHDLLSKLSIKNKLRRLSEKICYVVTKSSKDFLNFKELKELAGNHLLLQKISMIHLTKTNYFRDIKRFLFTLTSSSGKYESTFQEYREGSLVPCKVRNFYEKAKDAANLILAYVQSQRSKKIASIKLELVSDDEFNLWILDIPECFVTHFHETPASQEIQEIEIDISKKKPSKSQLKIENIASPDTTFPVFDDSSSEDDGTLAYIRRHSIVKKEYRKKRANDEDSNEKFCDFVEVLSKIYAKFGTEGTGKRISQDDIDKEYRRIAGILCPDSDSSRKQSQASLNFSVPISPPLFRNNKKNSIILNSHNSRKNSEIFGYRPQNYRIRILKTVKD